MALTAEDESATERQKREERTRKKKVESVAESREEE